MNIICEAITDDLTNNDLLFPRAKRALSIYIQIIDEVDSDKLLSVKVRGLDKCVLEQPGWLQYYAIQGAEISAAVDLIELEIDIQKSKVWKSLTENHSIDLSQMDKSNYIGHDDRIIKLRRMLYVLKEILQKENAIVDAFRAQGYALNSYIRAKQGAVDID